MVSRIRVSAVFVAIASATVFTALGLSNPRLAGAQVPTIAVTLVRDGVATILNSTASDVAGMLTEQNITLEPDDYLSISPLAPIENGTQIVLGTARDVLIHVNGSDQTIHTGAPTVAAALVAAGITVDGSDEISPALDSPVPSQIQIIRVRTWTKSEINKVPGGTRSYVYRYVQRDARTPQRRLVWTHFLRSRQAGLLAGNAIRMMATAYVPWCPGCSGVAKNGMRAGYGVVAVDPRLIPLGSKLYIPGYGNAIAGDTGGSITGSRIDLGFDNYSSAMQFGRRAITVYVIR